jgi:hypothetical protein
MRGFGNSTTNEKLETTNQLFNTFDLHYIIHFSMQQTDQKKS